MRLSLVHFNRRSIALILSGIHQSPENPIQIVCEVDCISKLTVLVNIVSKIF